MAFKPLEAIYVIPTHAAGRVTAKSKIGSLPSAFRSTIGAPEFLPDIIAKHSSKSLNRSDRGISIYVYLK